MKPGISSVITPNPKTSGGGALELPAAWGCTPRSQPDRKRRKSPERLRDAAAGRNVPVLDSGARGATTTFVQRGIGDVLLSWENEAYLALQEHGDKVQIIVPSISMLAEPSVAVVDKVVDKKGTRAVAEEYLKYLYSPEGQEIAAKNHYRPRDPKIAEKYASTFAKLKLVTIDQAFGGWGVAQKTHFADGGTFDQAYRPGGR